MEGIFDHTRVSGKLVFLVGAWRSLVAHLNGVQEAERSNRSAPTTHLNVKRPSFGLSGWRALRL